MLKVDGSISYSDEISHTEEKLFTYSEEEKQNNEINKANARLVFSPKFIPVYPHLLEKLTSIEAMLFGFIDFYTSSNERFYFTNEQLSSILRCSPDTVSRSMSNLEKKGFIDVGRKIRAGGGQIRFVRLGKTYKSDSAKPTSQTRQNLQTNKNKINKNKIKENILSKDNTETGVSDVKKSYGNKDINLILDSLKEQLNIPILGETVKTNRRYAKLCMNKYNGVDGTIKLIGAAAGHDFWRNNISSTKDLYYKGVKVMQNVRGGTSNRGGVVDARGI